MHLKEISINHYKSIKDPMHLRDFSRFQVLVGPNNAGKTNILDALHLFFDPHLEEERFTDEDADIDLTLVDENNKEYKLGCKGRKFHGLQEVDQEKYFIRIDGNVNHENVARMVKKFKKEHPMSYEKFTATLQNYFKEVEISEELFFLNVFADHKKRSIKRMGEGFKRLFVILFYIFHPQYKIILIDEPESHLHPSIIKKFLHILDTENHGNQVFLTTHHPSFIQAKHLPRTWRVARNERNNTSVYGFPEQNIDIQRFIQEINDDNSSMLFSDKVLLVEGVSDHIFMREMINKFYEKDKDIKVVYTSGKGSVDLYADLCEAYHIPYAIMLDRDAINSTSLSRVKKFPRLKKSVSFKEKLKILKENDIFILKKDLEGTYPKRYKEYKKKETKPLAALFVSQKITKEDLDEENMRIIKEIIERI